MLKFADNKIVSNPGSRYKPVYAPKVKKDGTIEVVPAGVEDFDAYINSFKEQTDIAFIIAKLNQGDTSVLQKHVGLYGDFTHMPSTFAEVLQLQIDAQRAFDSLSPDVKRKFDNDVNKFIAGAGSKEWFDTMEHLLPDSMKEVYAPASDPVVQDEVKE